MKMPGLAPGIFVSSASLNCVFEKLQKAGTIPVYEKTTKEEMTWHELHWSRGERAALALRSARR
jgi:hypothetical protein